MELNHIYSLTPEWQQQVAKQIGTTLVDNKIIIVPEKVGHGYSYFLQIQPGISVVLLDATFTSEIEINRVKSDNKLYIIHFDVSETMVPVEINDPIIDNSKFNSGFFVLHSSILNTFKPESGQKIFSLRILIDEDLLKKYLNFDKSSTEILYYNHLNSINKILLHSIKEKKITDVSFDSYIKGITLKLLSNFVKTYCNPKKKEISQVHLESISKTKDYLLNNLTEIFPGILFLSKMAGMSSTHYKILFKQAYDTTPYNFFSNKKLMLANKLLLSQTFLSVIDIGYYLSYSQYSYFSKKYNDLFGRRPTEDFIKK